MDIIEAVTVESLRDALHELGFRALAAGDANSASFVRSAVSGMSFDARLGSPVDGSQTEALDFRLTLAIAVEGELGLGVVNDWNNARRFGRLRLDRSTLLLDMDVSVAGGVRRAFLLSQFEIWSRLVGTLQDHLRRPIASSDDEAGRGRLAQSS